MPYATIVELHEDLDRVKTVRQLRAVLRAGVTSELVHHQAECGACAAARDRVEDPATKMHERVEHDLSWHAPTSDVIVDVLERLRTSAKNLAHEIVESTPPSREQSRALTSVEDALQQAIAAAVRNQ